MSTTHTITGAIIGVGAVKRLSAVRWGVTKNLMIAWLLTIPVSTTHTITGAIIGVGAVKRLSAVRWGVTKNLMIAWLLTIPVSAALAAIIFYLFGALV